MRSLRRVAGVVFPCQDLVPQIMVCGVNEYTVVRQKMPADEFIRRHPQHVQRT